MKLSHYLSFSFIALMLLMASSVAAAVPAKNDSIKRKIVHPPFGEIYSFEERLSIEHIGRHQHYNKKDSTYDKDVISPKSVMFTPQGTHYYINSLEGYRTLVFDARSNEKVAIIRHSFGPQDNDLWAKPSGFYPLNHPIEHPNIFSGKPVETTFSHDGRYAWIPYYRRSYDLNAQMPSAISVIDTRTNEIIRMMETGALPKMVVASPDKKWVAVSHWGENTVGLIDVSSDNPEDWHYYQNFVIGQKLKLNYSLTESVDRDVHSGYCLRGTVFTPDNRYLLVGCMGGGGGIAIIDLQEMKYLGRILGMMPNLRHLVIHNGWLYLSINQKGAVQRIKLDTFLAEIPNIKARVGRVTGWETCKIPIGARTISITPDGKYIFAACFFSSCVAVIDVATFQMIGEFPVDSNPVGLDISKDGRTLVVTSQGTNAVNLYRLTYGMVQPPKKALSRPKPKVQPKKQAKPTAKPKAGTKTGTKTGAGTKTGMKTGTKKGK